MTIRYNEQLGPHEAELLGLMLTNPASISPDLAQRAARLVADHLIRSTLSFRPSYVSFLAADADGLGREIIESDKCHLSKGLYVDWLETQSIGNDMYLSRIKDSFREPHTNHLTALAIVDPLPFDYEPLTRRMLEHLEKPGLERILISAGVICEDWIDQLWLEIDSGDVAEVRLQALAITTKGFDLSTFRKAIEPWLRLHKAKKFPDIVIARMH